MKKSIFLLILSLGASAIGQHYVDSTLIKDFNGDGTLDTLNYFKEYGSGSGGIDYKITNGKTNQVFKLSNHSSYGSSKKLIWLPPALLKKENEGFLKTFEKGLLPKTRRAPDASLQWIIDATYNSHALVDSTCFEKVFAPNTKWSADPYDPPSTYYTVLEGEAVQKLADSDTLAEADTLAHQNLKGYLIYFGNALRKDKPFVGHKGNPEDGLLPVIEDETYAILKTKHAILVKKGTAHKWLFVTDEALTDAPQKLRWASLDTIILKDGYLILKHDLAPNPEYNVYVIHIESGTCGKLRVDFDAFLKDELFVSDLTKKERLSFEEDSLLIGRGKNSLRVPFDEIKRTLTTFSGLNK